MCVRGAFGLFVLADRLARMGVTRGTLEPESPPGPEEPQTTHRPGSEVRTWWL